MRGNSCEKGRHAERLAAGFLAARGYRIWKSNWRWGRRELDLVTLFRGELVVVEVKARYGNPVNDPGEVIDAVKQRNIILATDAFIRLYHLRYPTRFDVVAVTFTSGGVGIEHFENAFIPGVDTGGSG